VLVFMVIALLLFGAFSAASFAPIALVIAAIVKSLRNSTASIAPGADVAGMSFTVSSNTRVIALDPGSPFAQAFGASLQRGLGGQLGETLAQMMTLAAAQQPLEMQLAPIVMAIEAARLQGDPASVRPFLTDAFAARFPSWSGRSQGGGPAAISHMTVPNEDRMVKANRVVIEVFRGSPGARPTEYWSFQRDVAALPSGTPLICPRCGAPTAADTQGTCRFCGATFSTTAPALPHPTRWLLDDVSATPPALAA
jgi:hypothetical protein